MLDELIQLAHINRNKNLITNRNTLPTHIVSIFPKSNQVLPYTSVINIQIRMDGSVFNIDLAKFITVKNITVKGSSIHGTIDYNKVCRTVIFTPTIAFEPKSTYQIKLRFNAIQTYYGQVRSCNNTIKQMFSTEK